MKTVQSLKNLCLYKIVSDSENFNIKLLPHDLVQEISDFHLLNAEDIVERCKKNIELARAVFKNKALFAKLGGYILKPKSTYLSTIFSFFSAKTEDTKLMTGGYLFEFLFEHKEIYEQAKQDKAIMNRLSPYQKEILIQSNKDLYQFYKCGR